MINNTTPSRNASEGRRRTSLALRLGVFVLYLTIASELQAQPRFIAHTTDAVLPAASLSQMTTEGRVVFTSGQEIKAGQLVELRREGKARPTLPRQDFLLMTLGDCLPLDPASDVQLVEGRLHVVPRAQVSLHEEKSLSLYLPYVTSWFHAIPDNVDDADLFVNRLALEKRSQDIVFLRDGDRVEGRVEALDRKSGCVVSDKTRRVEIPWSKLAGVAWNTARQSRPRQRGPISHAVLTGGGRLNFTTLRHEDCWIASTWFGAKLQLPTEDLIALDLWQGSSDYLSDLPSRYEANPYLDITWPWVKDASILGSALRLGNDTYDKGLGLHSQCKLTYSLERRYKTFEAVVGLDASASQLGRAKLALLLDGKRIDLNEGKEIRRTDATIPVRIDVRQVRELTLLVELGSQGDIQGHVDWANARLIKE